MDNASIIDAEQKKYWNSESADYWISRKQELDQLLEPWTNVLLGAAEIIGGEKVADIGCGSGATTLRFASSVGPLGHVIGLDISRKLIGHATRSARKETVQNVNFVEADAAVYQFPSPQDIVISRCGLMFFGNLTAAFANLRDGVKPTGRLLFVTWRAPEENEWYQFPLRCAARYVEEEPLFDPDAPGAFTLADPLKIERILSAAGFREIQVQAVREPLCVGRSPTAAAETFMEMGMIRKLLGDVSEELLEIVKQDMIKDLDSYKQCSGVFMDGTCWLVQANAQ